VLNAPNVSCNGTRADTLEAQTTQEQDSVIDFKTL
jgi:hypothetical protein